MKICDFHECGRAHYSQGLCQTHYKQRGRGEELKPIQWQNKPRLGSCTGPACGHWGNYGGLCWSHWQQKKSGQELRPVRKPGKRACDFKGCGREVKSLGLCQAHYRQSRLGKNLRPLQIPTYRYRTAEGYIRVRDPSHPNSDSLGRVLEHVRVMAEKIGRPLLPDETVHHINGVRDDNRPENLELWVSRHPKGQRVTDQVAWAREMLTRYAPDELREA